MDQATLRLPAGEQVAIDGRALLVKSARLSRQSLLSTERSGNCILQSRVRLVLSEARLDRSQRRLLATKKRTAA
jgi:hypothetical protein